MSKAKQKYFVTAGENMFTSTIINRHDDIYITGSVGSKVIDFENQTSTLPGPTNIFVAGLKDNGDQLFFKTAGSTMTETRGKGIVAGHNNVYATGILNEPDFTDFSGVRRFGESNPWIASLDRRNGHQNFFVNPNIKSYQSTITKNKELIFMGTSFSGKGTDLLSNPVNPEGGGAIGIMAINSRGEQKFFKYSTATFLGQIVASCPSGNFVDRTLASRKLQTDSICLENRCGCCVKKQKSLVFATGEIFLEIERNVFDFNGDSITGIPPFTFYSYIACLNDKGKQQYFTVAGKNVIGIGITHQGNVAFGIGNILETGGNDFSGSLIPLTNNVGVYVAGIEPDGKQRFFAVAQARSIIRISGITSDRCGVYVIGDFTGVDATDFNGNPVSVPNPNNQTCFVAGLTLTGEQKFFVVCSGSGIDITVQDAIFITGNIFNPNPVDFNGDVVPNVDAVGDSFAAALTFDGQQKYFVIAGPQEEGNDVIAGNGRKAFISGNILPPGKDYKGNPVALKGGANSNNVFVSTLKLSH